MKTGARKSIRTDELFFELKYCERCGGLWLRPVGGGQTYCVGCARQMAELPSSSEERAAGIKRGVRSTHGGKCKGSDQNHGFDEVAGGAA